jgi:hypothetical protein
VSRSKVVTEITIETSQVVVIKRRQITRSRRSECASEAEFVPFDKVNVLVDEPANQQGVEASRTAHFTDAADGSDTFCLWSLRHATTLVKRISNCLRRGSKRESGIRD